MQTVRMSETFVVLSTT